MCIGVAILPDANLKPSHCPVSGKLLACYLVYPIPIISIKHRCFANVGVKTKIVGPIYHIIVFRM